MADRRSSALASSTSWRRSVLRSSATSREQLADRRPRVWRLRVRRPRVRRPRVRRLRVRRPRVRRPRVRRPAPQARPGGSQRVPVGGPVVSDHGGALAVRRIASRRRLAGPTGLAARQAPARSQALPCPRNRPTRLPASGETPGHQARSGRKHQEQAGLRRAKDCTSFTTCRVRASPASARRHGPVMPPAGPRRPPRPGWSSRPWSGVRR